MLASHIRLVEVWVDGRFLCTEVRYFLSSRRSGYREILSFIRTIIVTFMLDRRRCIIR